MAISDIPSPSMGEGQGEGDWFLAGMDNFKLPNWI